MLPLEASAGVPLGLTVPVSRGGAGQSEVTAAELVASVSAADPVAGLALQEHFELIDVVRLLGTDIQQRRVFGLAMNGQALAATGPGPQLGRQGSALCLSGRARAGAGLPGASWLGVTAHDERDRLMLVFVPREAAGIDVDSDGGVITFENVFVQPGSVIAYWRAFDGLASDDERPPAAVVVAELERRQPAILAAL